MSNLDGYRYQIIGELGEPEPANCSWYDETSTAPWHLVDKALNAAEMDVGVELMSRGCEDSLIVKSTSITVPASTTTGFNEVAWSTLDTSGALPGSKILTIKDAANGLPVYFIMEPFDRMDMYDPGPMTRPATRFSVGSTGVILYKNTICFPYDATARTLVFYYIPAFGKMNGIASCTITNGGSGYTTAPTVEIDGDGAWGATATSHIATGAVDAVTIVNPGQNFGFVGAPTVTFSGGGGSSAAATVEVGVASVLPHEAYQAMIYRACVKLLRLSQRDESQMNANYGEALDSMVSLFQNDKRGKTFLRRPRYKGI